MDRMQPETCQPTTVLPETNRNRPRSLKLSGEEAKGSVSPHDYPDLRCIDGLWHYMPEASDVQVSVNLNTTSFYYAVWRRDRICEWEHLERLFEGRASEPCLERDKDITEMRKCAAGLGFDYAALQTLVDHGCTVDILARLEKARALLRNATSPRSDTDESAAGAQNSECSDNAGSAPISTSMEIRSILGLQPAQRTDIWAAFDLYYTRIARSQLHNKSPNQRRVWHATRRRAISCLVEAVGNIEMKALTHHHGQALFEFWDRRISTAEGRPSYRASTANTQIRTVAAFYKAFWTYSGEPHRPNPFADLKFRNVVTRKVEPFSVPYIRDVLLAEDTFASMNSQARGVLYAMIETGCRTSELANVRRENIVLDHPIPHLRLRYRPDRCLKTKSSERDIPLVGVALEVFRRFPEGFPRYADRDQALSAALTSYFRRKALYPGRDHRVYSLRHSFENRLLEAGIDYSLRCRLMGHHNQRDYYLKADLLDESLVALSQIVLPYPDHLFENFCD